MAWLWAVALAEVPRVPNGFQLPDEPGFRGAPTLTPLAAAVSGFTTGLERGLTRKGQRRQTAAERASRERIAGARAARGVSKDLTEGLSDITKIRQEEVRALRRDLAAKQKQFADPLFVGEKGPIQSDISSIQSQIEGISKGITDIFKVTPGIRLLPPGDQAIILGNLGLFTTGTFRSFADFENRIVELSGSLSAGGKKKAKELALSAFALGDIGIIGDDPELSRAAGGRLTVEEDDFLVDLIKEEFPQVQ